MASSAAAAAAAAAAEKATWREGDACLAPDPRDGTLREAVVQRLTSPSHDDNDTVAWVLFTDHGKDEEKKEEEEEEEEGVPVSKLVRAGSSHSAQEKPFFPSSTVEPHLCVPLELSNAADGDRVPYTVNRYLRDYQREGIRFIYNNYARSNGCVLGDDMGLGKTVQVIGFLAAVLHKTGTWEDVNNNRPQFLQSQMPSRQRKTNKVFLIVAPLSVLYNWKDELETWGHFCCVVVHGLRKDEELARIKKGRVEIALTTYETLRLCLDQFNNIDWSAVVVDEAHKIKNPTSQITQAMKDLRCKIRIGLTGTILQNNLEELWCVMDWAIPGCLGSLGHFKNTFSDPIEHGQRHSTTKRALATGRKAVRALARKISLWFLRRTKALIKEQLPKKDDRVVYCSLTDFQQTVYQTVLDTEDVTLMLRSAEKCGCQSGRTRRSCCYKTNSEGVRIKDLYFIYLAILRKVANHVALLQSTAGTSKKQIKYVAGICEKVFHKFPDFVQRCKDEAFEALSDPVYSGKMKVLQKLLKHYLQKRDKVLLFSLSTKLLDVLESYCMAEGLDYSRLDGNTKSKERLHIVKEFNSSSHVNICLVSTMAGGLGLNFVGANVVVLFDPTWNPANDLQAIDRAYRIGQFRDVTVLRLISLGTVEEVIYLRQVYKQQLQSSVVGKESARRYFEAVQGNSVYKGELFGLKNLFRLQTQGTCLTRQILEREGRVESGVMTSSTHADQGGQKEEEAKAVSKPGGDSPKIEPAKENADAPTVPRGVLDFSSEDDDDDDDDDEQQRLKRKASTANVGPGRMSLLQHGFSRLLERAKEKQELGGRDSEEESVSEEDDAEGDNREGPSNGTGDSSAGRGAVRLPKSATKHWDFSSGSDTEDMETEDGGRRDGAALLKQRDDAVKERPGQSHKRITAGEESDENSPPGKKKPNELKATAPRAHRRVEAFSDESEDLDIEATKGPKGGASNAHSRGGEDTGTGRLDRHRKRHSASFRDKTRPKHTEDIETFTSSEDEHGPVKRPAGCQFTSPQTKRSGAGSVKSGTKKQAELPKTVPFTNLKSQAPPASNRKDQTIDSVLGGVQEVMYTHSNQRVVGESKAEKLISRAAVRDVFEFKMYSQLPANHLVGTQESLQSSPPDTQPGPVAVQAEKPSLEHPVTFCKKSVHHTRHTTLIIGETPKAIRRQQLEEMVEKLKFPSARQFAAEILRGNSTQRLAWLRQYYTSLNQPDLAHTVANNFPQPEGAQSSPPSSSSSSSTSSKQTAATKSHAGTRTPQKDVSKIRKRPKCAQKNPEPTTVPATAQNNMSVPRKGSKTPQDDVREPWKKRKNVVEPLGESEEQEETVCGARGHNRTKKASVSSPGAHKAGGGLGSYRASSGLGSGETAAAAAAAAALLSSTDRGARSSPDPSHGRSASSSKPTAREGPRESPETPSTPKRAARISGQHSVLTDLIGDTSILDDLFKPKSRSDSAQQKNNAKTHTTAIPSSSSSSSCSSPAFTRHTDSGSVRVEDSLHSPTTNKAPAHKAKSKGSHRDFWDILNEGNEESINRLTDPAEVQRACVNTNFAARSRSGGEESKSVWKTNEKFLWKK